MELQLLSLYELHNMRVLVTSAFLPWAALNHINAVTKQSVCSNINREVHLILWDRWFDIDMDEPLHNLFFSTSSGWPDRFEQSSRTSCEARQPRNNRLHAVASWTNSAIIHFYHKAQNSSPIIDRAHTITISLSRFPMTYVSFENLEARSRKPVS